MNRVSAKMILLSYLCIITSYASISWGMTPSLQEGGPKQRIERTRQLMNDYKEGKGGDPWDICSFFSQFTGNEVSRTIKDQPEIIGIMTEAISDFPSAEVRGCAAGSAGWYGNKKIVPVLIKALNDNDKNVRLEAAGSLFQLGDEIEAALEIVDRLAREKDAKAEVLWPMYKWPRGVSRDWEELWHPECEVILKKALSYPSNEIKASAAIYFAKKGGKDLAETPALEVIEALKDKDARDYAPHSEKIETDPMRLFNLVKGKHLSGMRACNSAMYALDEIKSERSIPILKYIADKDNKWFNVCNGEDAKRILQKIKPVK